MCRSLRAARERAALTQSELAERAGVSRQMVGAVEAGRNMPAVDAALRIAEVLGEPVEALFGGDRPAPATVSGAPLRDGEPLLVGRVGERLIAAPLPSLVAGDAAWAAPDAVVQDGVVRMLPGAGDDGLVVAGCDPVLGLCGALLARTGRRVVAVESTSAEAAVALAAGRVHAAIVHGPDDRPSGAPAGVRRVHVARWQVGIGAAGHAAGGLLDRVLSGSVELVQRKESAASQHAFERAAARAGMPVPPAGRRASSHIDAARRAALAGCAAITFEPAAHQHDLGFAPLETHTVELWVDERWIDHPGARALCDLLASGTFRQRVGMVGGYDLAGSGAMRPAPAPAPPPATDKERA